MDLQEGE